MTDVPMKTVIALSKRYDDRLAVQLNAAGHLAQAVGHQAEKLVVVDFAFDQKPESILAAEKIV